MNIYGHISDWSFHFSSEIFRNSDDFTFVGISGTFLSTNSNPNQFVDNTK